LKHPVLDVLKPDTHSSIRLPLSMQIAARPFDEATALQAGQVYQAGTSWHLRQPALALNL
jgi:aspartyl-tRNA(Asn)/glutamyl-tRNA(Gln) amidotransferase subunit A